MMFRYPADATSPPRPAGTTGIRRAWIALGLIGGLMAWRPARADCIDDAARRYRVDADLLRAIIYHESRFQPEAIHRNTNGSVDIGLMQVNSIHLPALRRVGIDRAELADPCRNVDVGASLLRQKIQHVGATWLAVGEYHSRTPSFRERYARAVYDVYVDRRWLRGEKNRAATMAACLPVDRAEGVQVQMLTLE